MAHNKNPKNVTIVLVRKLESSGVNRVSASLPTVHMMYLVMVKFSVENGLGLLILYIQCFS